MSSLTSVVVKYLMLFHRWPTIAATAVAILLASPATAQKPDAAEKKKKADRWGFRWDEHPSLRLNKNTHIDFRARLQEDVRESDAPFEDEDSSALDVARRRIGVEGEIGGSVYFQVERELGDDDDAWRDVYANYKQFDAVGVQAGKFKLPFSLDENTGATNLDFVYRSRAATQLAPGRDRGAVVHGRLLHRVLRYEVGVFDHDGRNARSRTLERVAGYRTVAGRIRVGPFGSSSSPFADLHVGAAFTDSEVPEGFPALRGRTAFDTAFYTPNLWVNGRRVRSGLEAQWRPGPFSLKSEYIRVTSERLGESVEDTDLSPFLATGWYVSGTWAATGEAKAKGSRVLRFQFTI